LLTGRIQSSGPVVAILSGRNIDMGLHRRIINGAVVLPAEVTA
jgi:threonine dehydratase